VRAATLVLAITPWLAACGGDAPPASPDAGPGAGGDGALEIAPPAIPWWSEESGGEPPVAPPQLEPCPAGWRSIDEDGVTRCEPWPESGHADCSLGSVHFPGEPGCVPIGAACPAGDFADALPAAGVLYVLASAATGGDGTRARPFARVSDALAAATSGTIVAVGKGRYDEPIALPAGVTLRGACSAETLLTSSVEDDFDPIVLVASRGGAIAGVRIGEGARSGLQVRGMGASVELDGVLVHQARGYGIVVTAGSALTGHDLVISDSAVRPRDGTQGWALYVESGTVVVDRLALERSTAFGAFVTGTGAQLQIERAVIRDTQPRAGRYGVGIHVKEGGTLGATSSVIEINREAGLEIVDAGSVARLTSVVVRETSERALDGRLGHAIDVYPSAAAELRRCVVAASAQAAITVAGEALVEDALILDTRSTAVGGEGLHVTAGGVVSVHRARFERNHGGAIIAREVGSRLEIEDLLVRDTDIAMFEEQKGRGLVAQLGASVRVARAILERNHDEGISAYDEGTTLELEDVLVRSTLAAMIGDEHGRGLGVQGGATATARRCVFDSNREVGIFVGAARATLTLEDVVITDTQLRTDGLTGRGLDVELGAMAIATRMLVRRNHDSALYTGADAVVVGHDVRIEDTRENGCVPDGCVRGGIATGSYGGSLALERFAVRGAALCGVHVALDGQADLTNGEIAGAAIGACVQVDGYDLSRLTTSVAYHDNGTSLQTTELPVPEPVAPTP